MLDPARLPWWLPLALLAWAVHMLVYHAVALGFEWSDRTRRLRRFKVRPADRRSYGRVLPRVLVNQCLILLPAMLFCQWAGLAFAGAPHLGILRFVVNFALLGIGHDIVQYIAHRGLLHRARFQWLGHGVHHSTNASRSLSACFMAPADFFLEIVCPYLLPLVAIGGGGSDMLFHLIVPSLGAIGGLYEHSGYDLGAAGNPLRSRWDRLLARLPASFVSSHAHAEHHRRTNVSFSDGFGSPGLCDLLFRTRWDLRPQSGRPRPAPSPRPAVADQET
jgi:sterol desaturase/sphingolipid hydroxylase (fatty acid hydroxylase superfamily)